MGTNHLAIIQRRAERILPNSPSRCGATCSPRSSASLRTRSACSDVRSSGTSTTKRISRSPRPLPCKWGHAFAGQHHLRPGLGAPGYHDLLDAVQGLIVELYP